MDKGLIRLNDPISKYIPELGKMKIVSSFDGEDSTFTGRPAKNQITIQHLLTHTSGIGYGFQNDDLNKLFIKHEVSEGFEERDIALSQNIKRLATLPLLHEPGEKFTYGMSSDVLGYLIEVVSGQSYEEYLINNVLSPLEMDNTRIYYPTSDSSRFARVVEQSKSGLKPTSYGLIHYPYRGAQRYMSGGADLSSTALDYARFVQMLLDGGALGGKRILSEGSVELMKTPTIQTSGDWNGLGLGLDVIEKEMGKLKVTTIHFGGFFSTTFFAFPESGAMGILFLQIYPMEDWGIHDAFRQIVESSIY
ncbi:MAG TPA: serine hydrolase [Cytophagales bacterium]|nr:serine hydrolase [Cytophagales bacterium]